MIEMADLSIERPIGSHSNNHILELIKSEFADCNYDLISLPIKCQYWKKGISSIGQGDIRHELLTSPFSRNYNGKGRLIVCSKILDLENSEIENNILVLKDEITQIPLMPKDFPFYFPDENKKFYELVEKSNPACILTLTGKHQMSGLDPYPFFEDGNFSIPSCYASNELDLDKLDLTKDIEITIDSSVEERETEQLILQKRGTSDETIIICAHMDTKYGTDGALDNASGLYTLLQIAKRLEDVKTRSNIHIVPFNGEEYFGVSGQLKYLDYLKDNEKKVKLVINIDSPGYRDSKNALSFYNIEEDRVNDNLSGINDDVVKGMDWYAGDHAIFAFQGIPCIAATSSNLFEEAINVTHTSKDVLANVDTSLLNRLSGDLIGILLKLDWE
ncbi:M28 family peptidase [Methanolobus sp. ZRKC2]|uniref:M28 family metallopeptidase n=1 Tax=Methanolobus sp. ZRKC2 TaxID=3125783 RepID=UPI00324CF90D